jgi:hypothetical protein
MFALHSVFVLDPDESSLQQGDGISIGRYRRISERDALCRLCRSLMYSKYKSMASFQY